MIVGLLGFQSERMREIDLPFIYFLFQQRSEYSSSTCYSFFIFWIYFISERRKKTKLTKPQNRTEQTCLEADKWFDVDNCIVQIKKSNSKFTKFLN